jgi:hypothetical protein
MMTPDDRDDDALDERYRRASDAAGGVPGADVRAAILAEGRRVAEQQRRATGVARFDHGRPAANDRHWRLAVGTLIAAAIAGLIVVPIYREPPAVPTDAPLAQSEAPAESVAPEARKASPSVAAAPAPASAPMAFPNAAPAQRARNAPPSYDVAPPPAVAPQPAQPAGDVHKPQAIIAPALAGLARTDSAQRAAAPAAADAAGRLENYSMPEPSAQRAAAPAAGASKAAGPDAAAVLRAAIVRGDAAAVAALAAAGAPLNVRGEDGRTPLLLATVSGEAEVVRVLLAHGADPNAVGRDGRAPLAEARSRHLDAIAALLERAGAR